MSDTTKKSIWKVDVGVPALVWLLLTVGGLLAGMPAEGFLAGLLGCIALIFYRVIKRPDA